jgi:hypothetical protein
VDLPPDVALLSTALKCLVLLWCLSLSFSFPSFLFLNDPSDDDDDDRTTPTPSDHLSGEKERKKRKERKKERKKEREKRRSSCPEKEKKTSRNQESGGRPQEAGVESYDELFQLDDPYSLIPNWLQLLFRCRWDERLAEEIEIEREREIQIKSSLIPTRPITQGSATATRTTTTTTPPKGTTFRAAA